MPIDPQVDPQEALPTRGNTYRRVIFVAEAVPAAPIHTFEQAVEDKKPLSLDPAHHRR